MKLGRRSVAHKLATWSEAQELAAKGYWQSKAARKLGIHHTSAMYISRQMGFEWAPAPQALPPLNRYETAPRITKPVVAERDEQVERMLELARRRA